MPSSFNLVQQPFIPCLTPTGSREQVSLRDLFDRAPQLVAVSGDSPLQTAALYRFLLAILYRVLPIRSVEDWAEMQQQGRFEPALIHSYLDTWQHRFNLCDSDRPFYQTPHLSQYFVPIQKLFPERAAGNNDTLFDHTCPASLFRVDGASAARGLITAQAFSVGGLVSFEQSADRSAQAAPAASGLVLLITGTTVFDTLLRNLTRYDPQEEEPFPVTNADLPAWERPHPPQPRDRTPDGLRDLLTFQPRRLLLGPPSDAQSGPCFDRVAILKGEQLAPAWAFRQRDPYLAFRQLADEAPSGRWFPIGLKIEKAIWREAGALFSPQKKVSSKGESLTVRPYHFEWLSELAMEGCLHISSFQVTAFGQATDKATILLWREERLCLPSVFLSRGIYCITLQQALDFCEKAAAFLRRAVQTALQGLAVNSSRETPHLGTALTAYWSQLHLEFPLFLDQLAALPASENHFEGAEKPVLQSWSDAVRRCLFSAFERFADTLSTSSRALQATAISRRILHSTMRKHQAKYLQNEADSV